MVMVMAMTMMMTMTMTMMMIDDDCVTQNRVPNIQVVLC